jgi:hypothetical protein
MRWISTEPEFTWSGTLFIVGAFALFGAAQGAVLAARLLQAPRWLAWPVRFAGVFALVPLCYGPGMLLAPTIVFGGIAVSRADWGRRVVGTCAAIAVLPIAVVSASLIRDLGLTIPTLGRCALLVVTWGGLAAALWPAFAPWPRGE